MEGNTPTLQVRPIIRSPDDFWAAYTGVPEAAAVGLIRGLSVLTGQGKPFSVAESLDILIKIGHETDSELNQELRTTARLVLARQFASPLARQLGYDYDADSQITDLKSVDMLLVFFADDPAHSSVGERDLAHISRFIEACWQHHRGPYLYSATLTTGNYQLLPISALPDLYSLLTEDVPKKFPPLWWDGWARWPNEISGVAMARELKTWLKGSKSRIDRDLINLWRLCTWRESHPGKPPDPRMLRAAAATRTLLERFDTMCQTL